MGDQDDDLSRASADLLGFLRVEETWTDTLQRVASLACTAIPGCDSGSVTLWREGHPYTVVSTSELARAIDESQYETMEGPCLDASRYGESYVVGDMRVDGRWPAFSGIAAERGALSSLSLPLVVRGESLGALNLYSTREHGFDGAEATGESFARQASVALANARVYQASRALAESYEEALKAAAAVEQAKGRIMAERGVSAEEAARILGNAPEGDPGQPTLGE